VYDVERLVWAGDTFGNVAELKDGIVGYIDSVFPSRSQVDAEE
jgi:hypothetical protein